MPTSRPQLPDHRRRLGLHSADGESGSTTEDELGNAASIIGVDTRALHALQVPSPYRKIPVRLALLGGALIYVSTPHRAEEPQAADRSYRLTVR